MSETPEIHLFFPSVSVVFQVFPLYKIEMHDIVFWVNGTSVIQKPLKHAVCPKSSFIRAGSHPGRVKIHQGGMNNAKQKTVDAASGAVHGRVHPGSCGPRRELDQGRPRAVPGSRTDQSCCRREGTRRCPEPAGQPSDQGGRRSRQRSKGPVERHPPGGRSRFPDPDRHPRLHRRAAPGR